MPDRIFIIDDQNGRHICSWLLELGDITRLVPRGLAGNGDDEWEWTLGMSTDIQGIPDRTTGRPDRFKGPRVRNRMAAWTNE